MKLRPARIAGEIRCVFGKGRVRGQRIFEIAFRFSLDSFLPLVLGAEFLFHVSSTFLECVLIFSRHNCPGGVSSVGLVVNNR